MASVASCASPHRHPRACRHPRQLAPPPRLAARVPLADQRACRPRRRPDFEIVERVVAEAPNEDDLPPRFLVKWRSLPYANCTWESCRTLLPYQQAIERCRNSEQQPSANERKMATSGARPPKTSFKQLAKTPTYKAGHTLRSYQLEGLNWLLFSWYNRRSVMLADEMGLGKTVQSVTTLHHIWQHEGIRGPFLVLAPLSTLSHWLREFEGWTDMNTIVYHGSNESRELIRDVEFSFADPPKSGPPMYKFQVLITSYEVIKQDLAVFKKIPWRYMVVDEAHRLKNKVRPPRPAATRLPHRPPTGRTAHGPLTVPLRPPPTRRAPCGPPGRTRRSPTTFASSRSNTCISSRARLSRTTPQSSGHSSTFSTRSCSPRSMPSSTNSGRSPTRRRSTPSTSAFGRTCCAGRRATSRRASSLSRRRSSGSR